MLGNMEYQGLHNLQPAEIGRKKPKRLGRGESSGLGKTSGRGHKGQKSRKSGNVRIGFEGGQNPLARRLPKVGFSNARFKKEFFAINLGRVSERFKENTTVDSALLVSAGLLANPKSKIKLLAGGEMPHAMKFKVHAASKSAIAKVESVGGSVELLGKKGTV